MDVERAHAAREGRQRWQAYRALLLLLLLRALRRGGFGSGLVRAAAAAVSCVGGDGLAAVLC